MDPLPVPAITVQVKPFTCMIGLGLEFVLQAAFEMQAPLQFIAAQLGMHETLQSLWSFFLF